MGERGRPANREHAGLPTRAAILDGCPRWKLEDAKARFSELVRRAQSEGPQRVSVRGKDAVVVISAAELERMLPRQDRLPFVEFMESLYVEGLDLGREPDRGHPANFPLSPRRLS